MVIVILRPNHFSSDPILFENVVLKLARYVPRIGRHGKALEPELEHENVEAREAQEREYRRLDVDLQQALVQQLGDLRVVCDRQYYWHVVQ